MEQHQHLGISTRSLLIGKITPVALPVNGDAEDSAFESESKRIKLDKSPETNVETETKPEMTSTSQNEVSSNATSTTMVCTVNGFMEALKNRQQQLANAQQNVTTPKITTTSIMMDSNVAKNLVNQLLASAQGKIEVGTSASSSTNPTNLSVDQALDMSSSFERHSRADTHKAASETGDLVRFRVTKASAMLVLLLLPQHTLHTELSLSPIGSYAQDEAEKVREGLTPDR
ncbi:hypothetical protein ACTXT7_003325 [Hymenolepis weldensis]